MPLSDAEFAQFLKDTAVRTKLDTLTDGVSIDMQRVDESNISPIDIYGGKSPGNSSDVFGPSGSLPHLPLVHLLKLLFTRVVLPILGCSLCVVFASVPFSVVGLWIAAFGVARFTRRLPRMLSDLSPITYAMAMGSSVAFALLAGAALGWNLHLWHQFAVAYEVPVKNFRGPVGAVASAIVRESAWHDHPDNFGKPRPETDFSDGHLPGSGLAVYKMDDIPFTVAFRDHVGGAVAGDRLYCAAPIYETYGDPAPSKISTKADIAANWAVCVSKPLVAHSIEQKGNELNDYSENCLILLTDSSEEDQEDGKRAAQQERLRNHWSKKDPAFTQCLNAWKSQPTETKRLAYELEAVSFTHAKRALVAVTHSLENWSPLHEADDLPLDLFGGLSDLRRQSLLVLMNSCCSSLAGDALYLLFTSVVLALLEWLATVALIMGTRRLKFHVRALSLALFIVCSYVAVAFLQL